MYAWRQMTPRQRDEALAFRKRQGLPWHSPPHRRSDRTDAYLFTAACYEHTPVIGHSLERIAVFERVLLEAASAHCREVVAWVVLPDHYHFLARTADCLAVLKALGWLHGRTAFEWNGEEGRRGRHVWHNATETAMKSERHFWATINYVHHNPVKHGYVARWQDWPFSSAAAYVEAVGRAEAKRLWREYPIADYGKGWDEM